MCQSFSPRSRKGFTLVELAVVIVIIGVLAAFGVPRFLVAVERSKAAEGFAYLSAVRDSQERYEAQNGTYASDLSALDIVQSPPTYYSVGTCTATDNTWSCSLSRKGATSGYGQYTITFTELGFDSTNSNIPTAINPMGTANTGT
jgi:prepilin-type N-terminal cleavage/methylation domain-containing protein